MMLRRTPNLLLYGFKSIRDMDNFKKYLIDNKIKYSEIISKGAIYPYSVSIL